MAFGGPKGATLLSPKDVLSEVEDLNIYVSEFKINGVLPDSTILDENINFLDKIELNYNQNSLTFNVETPKLYGSKKQLFSWDLKGYDEKPTLSKNSRQATYSKLPSGAYSLETKVTNVDGELSSHTIGVVASMLFDFGVTTVGSMKDGNIIYGKVKKVLLNGKNEQ